MRVLPSCFEILIRYVEVELELDQFFDDVDEFRNFFNQL